MFSLEQKPTAKWVVVTPEQAQAWLGNNLRNRHVRPYTVKWFAAAMTEGRFHGENGETIKIGTDGQLLDGQHRLGGVVESGQSVGMWVMSGVSPDFLDTIDTGMKRTVGDTLRLHYGVPNFNAVGSAIRVVCAVRNDLSLHAPETRLAPAEAGRYLEAEPGIAESVSCVLAAHSVMGVGVAGGLHYLFAKIDRDAADRFFADLISGEGLRADDSVYVLRERLLKARIAKAKLPVEEVIRLVTRAWNRRGEAIAQLKGSIRSATGKSRFTGKKREDRGRSTFYPKIEQPGCKPAQQEAAT